MMVQLVVAEVQVSPPGLAVAVYDVIAEPPSDAGAVHDTAMVVLPGVTLGVPGAPGMVRGTPATAGLLAGPTPAVLVAVTVTV